MEIMMSRLFTYTIPFDDGAAPNPFNGMCSLAICKPGIRRVAKVGDWVAGLGSKNTPSGDLSGKLVYAMRVEKVVTLKEYDDLATSMWPHRVPIIGRGAAQEALGDCIYDYSSGATTPRQRKGIHDEGNFQTDLSGLNVLISTNFYYFGSSAEPLPDSLRPICHQTQGHKSTCNARYFDEFVNWIGSLAYARGQYGQPGSKVGVNLRSICGGCAIRRIDDTHIATGKC
jgi:hypothetical protein